MKQGINPVAIKIATGLPKLHDASVASLVELYEFMNGPSGCDIVKKVDNSSLFALF